MTRGRGPTQDPRRALPGMDQLLRAETAQQAIAAVGRDLVKARLGTLLDQVRRAELAPADLTTAIDHVLGGLAEKPPPSSLLAVLNATGLMPHTTLGKAPLAPDVVQAARYVDVEFDLATGQRASRGTLAALRGLVPEAGDLLVVNNGAAALVLAATTLAARSEVVVSRGEMVEIGDGFRLPALIESTGARIREVVTSNRTRLADYAAAVGKVCRHPLSARQGVDAHLVPAAGVVGGGGGPGAAPGVRGRCLLDLRCIPAPQDTVVSDCLRVVLPWP